MRRVVVAIVTLLLVGTGAGLWVSSASEGEPVGTPWERRAAAVVGALVADGLPVTDPVICRAPSPSSPEPPSSVAFRDGSVNRSYPRHIVASGGVVEVFASHADLRARLAQLKREHRTAQVYGFDEGGRLLHPERRIVRGNALLRLSGFISATQARRYAHAFEQSASATPDEDHTLQEAPCST